MADHSKFTKSSFSATARIEDVGVIVTDTGAQGIVAAARTELRCKFVIAPQDAPPPATRKFLEADGLLITRHVTNGIWKRHVPMSFL